jgi:hypothetical protein
VTRARAALFGACVLLLTIATPNAVSRADSQTLGASRVQLFVVDGVSFEELLSIPEISLLARAGGAALMTSDERDRDDPRKVYEAIGSGASPDPSLRGLMRRTLCRDGVNVSLEPSTPIGTSSGSPPVETAALVGSPCSGFIGRDLDVEWILSAASSDAFASLGSRREVLAEVGHRINSKIIGMRAGPVLVIVLSPTLSRDMARRGDEVTPLVLARAEPDRLPHPSGGMHSLRSGTTRQSGLVANVDVAPTILDFFGVPIPSEMQGQPIEFINQPAPVALHRRHLEQRRIRLPIQLAEVAFVAASGAVAIVVLLMASRKGSLSREVGGTMRFLALCVAALPIPLMLGGLLPRLTYWVVLPFIVVSVVGLASLASSARWPAPVGPITFLGIVGLAAVIVDALLGWRGARIPLLGGTMFDGARFYGLPNAFLCLLLAGAVFAAAALPAFSGFIVLVAAGLFAGFPSLGADVGGTITLFFAAGMWWVLRTRQHFRLKELAFVAGVTAMGLGVVLLANRYLPGTPTHATTFVEGTDSGIGGVLREFGDRLSVGLDQVRKAPAALIPLLGLPIILALVLKRPGPVGWGLEAAGTGWQHALIVLTLAGMVAFFVNDTGLAAAAPVFLYAMSGMAYPALLVSAARAGPNGGRRE